MPGAFRDDLEAARSRADALREENEALREEIDHLRHAPPAPPPAAEGTAPPAPRVDPELEALAARTLERLEQMTEEPPDPVPASGADASLANLEEATAALRQVLDAPLATIPEIPRRSAGHALVAARADALERANREITTLRKQLRQHQDEVREQDLTAPAPSRGTGRLYAVFAAGVAIGVALASLLR